MVFGVEGETPSDSRRDAGATLLRSGSDGWGPRSEVRGPKSVRRPKYLPAKIPW